MICKKIIISQCALQEQPDEHEEKMAKPIHSTEKLGTNGRSYLFVIGFVAIVVIA